MAVGRPELEIPEMQGILALMDHVRKGHDLFRGKRELQRALDRALESDRLDKENIARQRRNRAARLRNDGESLTPQSMTRRGWRQG